MWNNSEVVYVDTMLPLKRGYALNTHLNSGCPELFVMY